MLAGRFHNELLIDFSSVRVTVNAELLGVLVSLGHNTTKFMRLHPRGTDVYPSIV